MRRRLRRRAGSGDPTEINITAFMNLMVILVPFLLITAVFSRITILELNIPAASAQSEQAKEEFKLEVIVRQNSIEVGDVKGGLITRIDAAGGTHDYKQLSEVLQAIKARFPDKLDSALLVEADTSYETVVAVMDSLRTVRVVLAGSVQLAELFPDISIGDAPPIANRVIKKSSMRMASSSGDMKK